MAIGKGFPGVKSGNSPKGLVSVDIKPLPLILVGQFEAFAVSVKSYKAPLQKAIKEAIIPSIQQNFDMEGRPFWEPLSPATIYKRQVQGYDAGPILQRSGRGMRAAVAMARWRINLDEAYYSGDFPASAKYMPIHQIASVENVSVGKGGFGSQLDGRPFAMIQPEDERHIEEIFAAWMTERAIAARVIK